MTDFGRYWRRATASANLTTSLRKSFGIGDAGGLLGLAEFLVQELAVQQLPGIGILEILILDPGIGVVHVAVEQVLAVIVIGFEIGLLDFVPDELGVARARAQP